MTDVPTAQPGKILTDRRLVELPDPTQLVVKAARSEGISPLRILREIATLMIRRRNGITAHEYFGSHLYRKDLSMAEKRAFVGEKGNYRLNLQLSPPALTQLRGFLRDKLTFSSLWRQFGVPTTVTRAVYSSDRWLGTIPVLRDAAAIASFLIDEAQYPLFGKPVQGIQALGTIRIIEVDRKAGTLQLADGREVPVTALAEEIVRDFPDGYMFQDVVAQHPAINDLAGPALSCVRFVTVMAEDSPQILYTTWKLASPEAMSDNFWQQGSMLCRVNPATGIVEHCITGKGPDVEEMAEHPVSHKPILGFEIPHWQAAADMVRQVHAIFPVNGCLGWDVAIGPDGPVVIECNENPGHEFYQLVNGRGILAPEVREVLDRVIARNKAVYQDRKARVYKIEH